MPSASGMCSIAQAMGTGWGASTRAAHEPCACRLWPKATSWGLKRPPPRWSTWNVVEMGAEDTGRSVRDGMFVLPTWRWCTCALDTDGVVSGMLFRSQRTQGLYMRADAHGERARKVYALDYCAASFVTEGEFRT